MALPLALVATGAALSLESLKGCLFRAGTASAIKVVLSPLVGAAIAVPFVMTRDETAIALLYLACPTAVVSFVMAEQLGADHELAGSIVVFSTLISMPVLGIILLWI
jgi:predicted permease